MRVNVHAHIYPEPYVAELKKIGEGDDGRIGIKLPKWSSAEQRIHVMDKLGVDIQILALSSPNVYFRDAELSVALAQMTNDFVSDVCKKYPRRFLCLASLPLNNEKCAIDELHRSIGKLGMDGAVLGTNINGHSLSEDRFLPILEEIDRQRIPTALHPMKAVGEELLLEEDIMLTIPSSVGFIFETSRTVAQMIFKGTFERYQNLTFILPHSGGAIPFIYPRWDMSYFMQLDSHPLRRLPKVPSSYLSRHYYDTALSFSHSSLRCTLDLAGIDHLLFGTDSPYSHSYGSKEAIEKIETYSFSNEDKRRIYFDNAARIFPKLRREHGDV